jgi:hypothetical protein
MTDRECRCAFRRLSIGTLVFNVTTFQALSVVPTNGHYDRLIWRPDGLGSICFLISGTILYVSSPRRGLWPTRGAGGWWEPGVNLLGCIFFGISAVAGYVVPSVGSILDLAAANWNTSLGATCFLVVAMATLRAGRSASSHTCGHCASWSTPSSAISSGSPTDSVPDRRARGCAMKWLGRVVGGLWHPVAEPSARAGILDSCR